MGCRALALLLLTLAVAVALPSSAAGGRGARTGSSTEAISIQDIDAVFFPSPAQDQEVDPTGTKSITSTLMSAGAASRESSFTPEAYNVKWNHKRDHNPPHDGAAAHWNSFTPEAYPVKCKHPSDGGCAPPHAYVAETTIEPGHDDLHIETGMLFTRKSMFPGAILPEGTKFAGNGFPDSRRFVFREDADAILRIQG